jgi:hypothetical protein
MEMAMRLRLLEVEDTTENDRETRSREKGRLDPREHSVYVVGHVCMSRSGS